MKLIDELKNYIPWNEQEKEDKIELLHLLNTNKELFDRNSRMAHMTASAWVLNKNHDKVLMVHHNLYNSWSWLGGHADGDNNLLNVAVKEVKEESGLSKVKILSDDIFSIEILTVEGHARRQVYVPSHLHLNITYLLEADEEELLTIAPDENSDVRWFTLTEAVEASTEPWFKERIYSKLNNKLAK